MAIIGDGDGNGGGVLCHLVIIKAIYIICCDQTNNNEWYDDACNKHGLQHKDNG